MSGWMQVSVSGRTLSSQKEEATRFTTMRNQTPGFPGTLADLHHGPLTQSPGKSKQQKKGRATIVFGARPYGAATLTGASTSQPNLQRTTP